MSAAYVNAITAKGRTYFYTRLPARFGTGNIRLPDDRAAAEAIVQKMMGEAALDELEEYATRLMASSRQRAKEKKIAHTLRKQDVVAMIARQGYRCAVSGVPLSMEGPETDPFLRAFAPSLDRIDNLAGYTRENCRIVCRIVNFAMGRWGADALRVVALAIAEREGVDRERHPL